MFRGRTIEYRQVWHAALYGAALLSIYVGLRMIVPGSALTLEALAFLALLVVFRRRKRMGGPSGTKS
jgi:hypothetical protein